MRKSNIVTISFPDWYLVTNIPNGSHPVPTIQITRCGSREYKDGWINAILFTVGDMSCAFNLSEATRTRIRQIFSDLIARNRLTSVEPVETGLENPKPYYSFQAMFRISPGKGFCRTALEVAFDILKSMGIPRKVAQDFLRGMNISTERGFMVKDKWVSMESVLIDSMEIFRD